MGSGCEGGGYGDRSLSPPAAMVAVGRRLQMKPVMISIGTKEESGETIFKQVALSG